MTGFKHVVTAVIVTILGGLSRPATADTPASTQPSDAGGVHRQFRIEAGKQMEFTFSNPSSKTPGILHGHWSCRGRSADLHGANDDTLVKFVLRGPNDKIIEKREHPTSGNFSVRFDKPGSYTFIFDNSGILRSSDRIVVFDGVYDAD